ncbi:MAG: hypothetical protein QE280_02745 [Caulobacter sp.]|nr:hypothetical protein [Caulobacter sp.]
MTNSHQIVALCLLLCACGAPTSPASEPPAAQQPKLPEQSGPKGEALPAATVSAVVALDGEGLRLVTANGSTALLAFDRNRQETIAALSGALGPPVGQSANSECGAGPTDFVDWGNGLSVLIMQDRFVGWSLDPEAAGGLTTMNGIGVGSSRAALVQAFSDTSIEESTLGQEFTAGGLSGLLDSARPDARIEALWAGTACVFR